MPACTLPYIYTLISYASKSKFYVVYIQSKKMKEMNFFKVIELGCISFLFCNFLYDTESFYAIHKHYLCDLLLLPWLWWILWLYIPFLAFKHFCCFTQFCKFILSLVLRCLFTAVLSLWYKNIILWKCRAKGQ
jgi:hypothetical protein